MTRISPKHENLAAVYDQSFIESLDPRKRDEAVIRDMLTCDSPPQREKWRKHLDACVAVARRHGLLAQPGFLGRLRSKRLVVMDSAFCELAAAMYLERGGNQLEFYPAGSPGRVLEFKVARSGIAETFVEVKALFGDDLDRAHDLDMFYVKECVGKCPLPFAIAVNRLTPNQQFSRKKLLAFLKEELTKLHCLHGGRCHDAVDLPPYKDPSGFRAEFSAIPIPDASHARYVWSIHPMRDVRDRDALKKRLMDAYDQLPNGESANMVVIDVSYRDWLMREDVLTALFGGRHVERSSNDREYNVQGHGPGFWGFWRETNGHSKLSTVMLIRWLVMEPETPFVRVFHNPWASRVTSVSLFPDGTIHYSFDAGNQIVHASHVDSEWM